MSNKDHRCNPSRSNVAVFFKRNTQNYGVRKIKVFFITSMWFCSKPISCVPKHALNFQDNIDS